MRHPSAAQQDASGLFVITFATRVAESDAKWRHRDCGRPSCTPNRGAAISHGVEPNCPQGILCGMCAEWARRGQYPRRMAWVL